MNAFGPLDPVEAVAVLECAAARDLRFLLQNEVSIKASLDRTRADILKKVGEHQAIMVSILKKRGGELTEGQSLEVKKGIDGSVSLGLIEAKKPEPQKPSHEDLDVKVKALEHECDRLKTERDAAARMRDAAVSRVEAYEAHYGKALVPSTMVPTAAAIAVAPAVPSAPVAPVAITALADGEIKCTNCERAAIADVTWTILPGISSSGPMCESCADVLHAKSMSNAEGVKELHEVKSFYFNRPSWADEMDATLEKEKTLEAKVPDDELAFLGSDSAEAIEDEDEEEV